MNKSKTNFTEYTACPKQAWYSINRYPKNEMSFAGKAIIAQGYEVEELATELFPDIKKSKDFFCSSFNKNLFFCFFNLNLSNSLLKDFSTTSLFNKHILRDMPKGTRLYFENQDINLIIVEFKFLTFIFLEIFLSLNFFSVVCSCGQITPVTSLDPKGAFTKSPGFNF